MKILIKFLVVFLIILILQQVTNLVIEKTDEYWMRYALNLAYYAEFQNEVPVGAVLIYRNEVIGEGWNRSISCHDPTAHAEIVALRQGGQIMENYRLPETSLYVTLEPCIMCIGAIMNSRINRLIYGAKDNKLNVVSFISKIQHHIKIHDGILASECAAVMINFFRMCRNKRKNPLDNTL